MFGAPDPKPTQEDILRSVAFGDHPRVVISTYTRYGKTFWMARGAAMRILFDPRPLDFRLLGPTEDQTEILRGYVVDSILRCPLLREHLQFTATDADRLKVETSRRKLTFKDGKVLWVQTAGGDAFRLMGHGGDVLIVIESALITDDAWGKVMRMLGNDGAGGWLIEEGNPWSRGNHFERHWNDPAYHRIHASWRTGLREGRHTQAWFDEQRRELSPVEWQVLYESQFPDQAESQLIAWQHIQHAATAPRFWNGAHPDTVRVAYVIDVAEGGGDETVLSRFRVEGTGARARYQCDWQKARTYADTEQTADWAHAEMEPASVVFVDAIGVGKGVADKLRRRGHGVREVKVSRKAHLTQRQQEAPDGRPEAKRFLNQKAEIFWTARQAFEDDRMRIPNEPRLHAQLSLYRFEVGPIRVTEECNKSPDRGDSLCYVFANPIERPKPQGLGVARVL